MSASLFWFVLLTPVWAASLHALVGRVEAAKAQPRQRIAFLCCVVSVALVTNAVLILEFFIYAGDGTLVMFAGIASTLLAHIYFHIFNMSETARRIRILLEIQQGISPEASPYGDGSMVNVRLDRLCELGQISLQDGRYVGKRSFLGLASRIVYWHERLLFPRRFKAH